MKLFRQNNSSKQEGQFHVIKLTINIFSFVKNCIEVLLRIELNILYFKPKESVKAMEQLIKKKVLNLLARPHAQANY